MIENQLDQTIIVPPPYPEDSGVDISNATVIDDEDGGVVVQFGELEAELKEVAFGDNLADAMDDDQLAVLATDLIGDYEADRSSREQWEKTYIEGLDLLGLKFEDRSEPWDGACGVFHPMLAESVVRFQAQTVQEVFPASGPVKVSIAGKKSDERIKQGHRVKEYMNYLCTKEMSEYRNETERLLFSLPLAGSAFRKIYYDPTKGRPCAMFVPAEDYVVSYSSADLDTAERATHVMLKSPNWVRKMQVNGFYRDVELGDPMPDPDHIRSKYNEITGDDEAYNLDGRHTLLEMGVEIDLEGFEDADEEGNPTGVALPYIVTIDKTSSTILGIRRNWLESDPAKVKREHVVQYQYLPGLGFYGFGLVHMIGGLSKSATSLLRQLVDAGTLANLPAGLKTRGLHIKGDDEPLKPGEFRDVDVPSGSIKDNLTFLPYKEPSSVLYQLLGDIVEEGRRFASAADVKAADMNGEAPVGTTLAILEREMKVLSAVQARVHTAMGKELVLISKIIKDQGPENYPYEVEGNHTIREDFDDRVDIIPVSDPNSGTMAQRIMQYQAALQLASTAPQMYDMPVLHRQMLAVLGVEEAEKIIPNENDLKPTDPVSENMAIMTGEPVKAFMYQDHEAHIQTHMAAAENPQIIKMMQSNPQAQAVMAQMAAHIASHVAMAYRQKIEQELGVELPDPDEPMPEDIELRLSRLVAPAAAQLTGKAKQQEQAEKNAEEQKDPILILQQEELELKKRAQSSKEKEALLKLASGAMEKIQKLQLQRDQLDLKARELEEKYELKEGELAIKEDQLDQSGEKIGLDFAAKVIAANQLSANNKTDNNSEESTE